MGCNARGDHPQGKKGVTSVSGEEVGGKEEGECETGEVGDGVAVERGGGGHTDGEKET